MSLAMSDRVVAVTGAANGIGRATALAFAAAGAQVVVADTDAPGLTETWSEVEKLGHGGRRRLADVSRRTDIKRVIADCLSLGGLDVMVANAGVSLDRSFLEVTEEELDRTLAVNLKGVFFCGQLAARAMIQFASPGVIVNIASIYGEVAAPDCSAYSASKGGVRMLTKAMALELGPHGIRVNAVAPGFIRTAMNPMDDPAQTRALEETIPAGRVGRPEDVADVIVWLASGGARYVSGETVFVDGGWIAR